MQIRPTNYTYGSFLQKVMYNAEVADSGIVSSLIGKLGNLSSIQFSLPQAIFAIDYTKKEYLLWNNDSRKFGSYNPERIMEDGLENLQNRIDPICFKTFAEKMFPATLEALQQEGENAIISLNYKVQRMDGSWMETYQKSSFLICPKSGLPSATIGVLTDITEVKHDNYMYHAVERINQETNSIELISRKRFNPFCDDLDITARELNVLQYLAEGSSSKQIGDKLKISTNTVNNHRQNMLAKTNCSNVAELIAFALRSGLIR